MTDFPSRLAASIVGGVALLALAAPANAQVVGFGEASEAFAISASFTSLGMSTDLGPIDDVAGSAPPAYNKTKILATYQGAIAVPPLVPSPVVFPIVATFSASAQRLRSHVVSGEIEIDYLSAIGTSNVKSANLAITSPGPPGTTYLKSYLNVSASDVVASATYSLVVPNHATATGSASFGSLTIGGALLDGETVTYSGSPPPNTVLYQSATVTITAHQQFLVGLISCDPSCTFTPDRIAVHALDISLNNAVIDGQKVTGEIVLGDASAQ